MNTAFFTISVAGAKKIFTKVFEKRFPRQDSVFDFTIFSAGANWQGPRYKEGRNPNPLP